MFEFDGATPVEAADMIEAAAEGLIDPVVAYDYPNTWDDYRFMVIGFVPMTEKEIEKAEKRRKAARVAAKARTEKQKAEDEAELLKLADKLGFKVEKE